MAFLEMMKVDLLLLYYVVQRCDSPRARLGDPVVLQSLDTLNILRAFESDPQSNYRVPYFGMIYTRRAGG